MILFYYSSRLDWSKSTRASCVYVYFGCVSVCILFLFDMWVDVLLFCYQAFWYCFFFVLFFCGVHLIKLTFSLRWCNCSQWLWNYLWKLSVYGRISCVQIVLILKKIKIQKYINGHLTINLSVISGIFGFFFYCFLLLGWFYVFIAVFSYRVFFYLF